MTTTRMGMPEPADNAGNLRAAAGQDKPKDGKLYKAAQEFEAYFVATMLKQMRKAVPAEGMLHSKGEDMFRDLMDDQIGQDISKGQGIGLADMLYRQLSLDEGQSGR